MKTGHPRRALRFSLLTLLRTYLLRHLQVFFYSLGQLIRHPFSLFMTAAVIGIALALPTGLHVVLKNIQQLSGEWDRTTQISVFLKTETSEQRARDLQKQISRFPEVEKVSYISKQQALDEFQRLSGFGDALKALQHNPLPSVLLVQPRTSLDEKNTGGQLIDKLQRLKGVDIAQRDEQWIKRLYAIIDIVRRGVVLLSIMLALAVLLVVGNTIRLAIQNRRDEIIVTKLIGGTNAFIRRPFLYTGFWYGLFGGFIALLLVSLSLLLLNGPVEQLTSLYQGDFSLANISFATGMLLLLASILLGLAGSWLAVGRHLRDIEPR
ncbi:MAG: permease-like cell division protein FtsX [Thioalkalispiraceae bacterium]|jgi:cell division transport system permease protein